MPRSSDSADDWRETRRLRAWELYQQGWSQTRIARELGVTQSAVSRWFRQAQEAGGIQGLLSRRAPGKAARLTEAQREQIPSIIAAGAQAFGFDGDHWTTRRVASVFQQLFGVSYHPGHISKLLKQYSPDWHIQQTG
jgi:transposase